MKRAIIIACCLVLGASIAFAQSNVGSIDVFSDAAYADCNFTDVGGLITVYVLATHSADGTSASQWMMDIPSAWMLLGSTSPFQTVIGDPLNGVSIAYGSCITGSFLILTVNFLGDALSPTCSYISIVPDPASPSGLIEIVDCQTPNPSKWLFDALGRGVVNGDQSCACDTPVQDTTWGGIKALYE
jgi:hypothetical protein